MNEKVKAYLDHQKEAEKVRNDASRKDTLLALGLFEKEYSPNNVDSSEYPYFEWDTENSEGRYFKKIPVDITEEEYQEVLKYAHKKIPSANRSNANTIASIFSAIAWIVFIIGFIAGFIIGSNINYGMAAICWVSSFLTGLPYLALAEIIKLLTAIKNK